MFLFSFREGVLKTGKSPAIRVSSRLIKEISPQERERLLSVLHSFAKRHVKSVNREYLNRRLQDYKIITLIQQGIQRGGTQMLNDSSDLLGFSFSSIYFLSGFFLKIPVFHCGLTLLHKNFRRRGLSLAVSASLYELIIQKKMISRLRLFFAGVLFTAKCSSPVSFLKIRRFAFRLSWPKIKDRDNLSFLSRTKPSQTLSRALSERLAGEENSSRDFILRGINTEEDVFQLNEEIYSFKTEREREAVRFFKKHIMPQNELITIAWFHPLILRLQKSAA